MTIGHAQLTMDHTPHFYRLYCYHPPSYCEGNYSTPFIRRPFTPTHNVSHCEGNYSSPSVLNYLLPHTQNLDPHPFALCQIFGNIRVCDGCQNKYSKYPSPPDDLYIQHQDWCEYVPEGTCTGIKILFCKCLLSL